MSNKQWLKKYTKLEYLEQTLKKKQLHLGDPTKWPDKNDSTGIQRYSKEFCDFDILGTCLTQARDRFHFWHIFGEKEHGVCLWFDRNCLIEDIKVDSSLVARKVQYRMPNELKKLTVDQLPFAKRKQYRDECEFRVLRQSATQIVPDDKFLFSADSLKRIYLNPWLSPEKVDQETQKIEKLRNNGLEHVEVKQNRTLENKEWIDAICDLVKRGH